ncbi:MAG TPA: hypothetical protein VMZ50_10575 [Phycisphaerae bacterium]|nr:hypothetical protein [Phycisphaerae bacterium]
MVTVVHPWVLLGLVAVAAVGAWALFRPGRLLVAVGTLSLWQRAVDSLSRSARQRSRKVSLGWLLLLGGAVAAVLAAARPVHFSEGKARRVAIALYPSAEIASPQGMDDLRRAAAGLLDRLDERDRVQLLLPSAFGAAAAWLSVPEARKELRWVSALPARGDELILPPPDGAAQHVYCFVPAGVEAKTPAGPGSSVIEIPPRAPPATFDAFAAEPLAAGGVQVFAAIRNHRSSPWSGELRIGAADGEASESYTLPVSIGPAGRSEHLVELRRARRIEAALLDAASNELGRLGTKAFLARREGKVRKIAVTGGDEPLLRRFIRSDPLLELAGRPADADVVIANGRAAPTGKPALVIDPPVPPAPWRHSAERGPILLPEAGPAGGDDPVMRAVDLTGVAVRRVRPWAAQGDSGYKRLCELEGEALILRNSPEGAAGPSEPRRIYVAFDLNTENTNFAMREAFVVFLANSVRWLSGALGGGARFGYQTPLEARDHPAVPAGQIVGASRLGIRSAPLPLPGLYSDGPDRAYAVTLVGLGGGTPPGEPSEAVRKAPIPPATPAGTGTEYWPALVIAAMGLWATGWALRTR